jgi:hypothetical protein
MGLSSPCGAPFPCPTLRKMKIIFLSLASFLTTFVTLLAPGGTKALLAENLLLKQ